MPDAEDAACGLNGTPQQSAVYSTAVEQADELARSLRARPLLVVGFCAAWCDTCTLFRIGFEELAAERPEATFVWLDIEDDADIAGDIEIENFPTIAVFDRNHLKHFGVSLPQTQLVGRLLDSFDASSKTIDADSAVTDLPVKLASRPSDRVARSAVGD